MADTLSKPITKIISKTVAYTLSGQELILPASSTPLKSVRRGHTVTAEGKVRFALKEIRIASTGEISIVPENYFGGMEQLLSAFYDREIAGTAQVNERSSVTFQSLTGRDGPLVEQFSDQSHKITTDAPISKVLGALVDLGLSKKAAEAIAAHENIRIIPPPVASGNR